MFLLSSTCKADKIVFEEFVISCISFPNFEIISVGSTLDIDFTTVLKFSFKLRTIDSKPLVNLSISFLRSDI